MSNGERAAMFRDVATRASPVTARIFTEIAAARAQQLGDEWLEIDVAPAREPGEEG